MCDTILYECNTDGAQKIRYMPELNVGTLTVSNVDATTITTTIINTTDINTTDLTVINLFANNITVNDVTAVEFNVTTINSLDLVDPIIIPTGIQTDKDVFTDAFPYVFNISKRAGKLTLSPVNLPAGNDLGITINYAGKLTNDVIIFQPYIYNSAVTDISVNIISDNPTNWIVQITNNDPAVSYIVDLTLNYFIV